MVLSVFVEKKKKFLFLHNDSSTKTESLKFTSFQCFIRRPCGTNQVHFSPSPKIKFDRVPDFSTMFSTRLYYTIILKKVLVFNFFY